jgi:hypothetical protein
MSRSGELAANCWEVERENCGSVLRPYCLVILKSKEDARKTVVKASSSDLISMDEYAEELRQDLGELTNEEFVEKYELRSAA